MKCGVRSPPDGPADAGGRSVSTRRLQLAHTDASGSTGAGIVLRWKATGECRAGPHRPVSARALCLLLFAASAPHPRADEVSKGTNALAVWSQANDHVS